LIPSFVCHGRTRGLFSLFFRKRRLAFHGRDGETRPWFVERSSRRPFGRAARRRFLFPPRPQSLPVLEASTAYFCFLFLIEIFVGSICWSPVFPLSSHTLCPGTRLAPLLRTPPLFLHDMAGSFLESPPGSVDAPLDFLFSEAPLFL